MLGYVVCPNALTPVELDTDTAEAAIPLPITGTPVLGDFAIAVSPDGHWAYVVTSDGVISQPSGATTSVPPATTGSATSSTPTPPPAGSASVQNVVIPVDLVTQRAERPIAIPGAGGTHAIVVMSNGQTILAASGSSIVPIDAATRRVGTPLDLGAGRTIFGIALDPVGSTLFALVPGAVIPVNTANATAGAAIPTGLSVSSVYSPHGITVTDNGATVYVVGQGGTDFGGRVLPIVASTGVAGTATGFDRFGISDPAAVAVTSDGSTVLVADAANNWVNPIPVATFSNPSNPVRLPQLNSGSTATATATGTGHPTDIVIGPGQTQAFLVDGFDAAARFHTIGIESGHAMIPQ
jgi:DNA-binding beta-propeller fold protein YncE